MDKEKIHKVYTLALLDLKLQIDTPDYIRNLIKERESKSDYEGCAGLLKALNEFEGSKTETKN